MPGIVYYLLQVIICSGILYGYYHFILRNKKFHQYNRFYLIGTVVISVAVPFIQIPVYFSEAQSSSSVVLQTLASISYNNEEIEQASNVIPVASNPFNWYMLIYIFYGFIALLLITKMLFSLYKLKRIISKNKVEQIGDIHFINTDEPGTPFSFFRWLFWDKKIELQSPNGKQIFRHEVFHIREKHSHDILFMEILSIICWINPFFFLIKKELKAIHEFLADQFAATESSKWAYAELLLMQVLNTKQQLVNPFFHNQIKRRIAMITNPKKTSHQYLRKLLVLPVAAFVLVLFAFTYKTSKEATSSTKTSENITVVIDAGHGGKFTGTRMPESNYSEAQLSLELAKKIQQLAAEYNVTVVMTRENDETVQNAATLNEDLRKRVAITNNANADAFISLHMNADGKPEMQTKRSGFEIYVSGKRKDDDGVLLGSIMLKELSAIYKIRPELQKRNDKGIWVLDDNTCASILIECGYINNQQDLDFITNAATQEKLARTILEGVIKYKTALTPSQEIISQDTIKPKKNNKEEIKEVVVEGYKNDKKKAIPVLDIAPNNEIVVVAFKKDKENIITDKKKQSAVEEVVVTGYSSKKNNNNIFLKTDISPVFSAGEPAWRKYLERFTNANTPSDNGAAVGVYHVMIQYVVNEDGSISDIQALTNFGYGMEAEAIRVIKNSPAWTAAIQNGKKVSAYRKQPITFQVVEDIKEEVKN